MKKQIWIRLSNIISDWPIIATILFCVSLMAFSPAAQSQVVSSTQNSRQIALLHWYEANQTTSFPVGDGVYQYDPGTGGLAFDGANIWLAWDSCDWDPCVTDPSFLSKVRASDGAVLGTFAIDSPGALAF